MMAYGYQGGVSIEYLMNASAHRVDELATHFKKISEEIKKNG